MALSEDLSSGDLTSEAIIGEDARAVGIALAKSRLVVAGAALFETVFRCLDPDVVFETFIAEGAWAEPGQNLWRVSGGARALLGAERSALNFVQRASGTATLTRRCVEALPAGSRARITDTRKTTPGLRALERYAVRAGGGHNHRDNLGSAILIKDNHIAVAGGVRAALERARQYAPHTSRIEVEVTTLEMLDEALAVGADCVMLDNFSDQELQVAVGRAAGRALLEVSGGVTLPRVATLGALGVDVISIGALTHSAGSADISLEVNVAAG
jgi:nicotinate-nucleotide pyrophosphorylase (carboxylating)